MNSSNTQKILLIAIAGVVVLVAIILAVTALKSRNKDDDITTVPTTEYQLTTAEFTTGGFLWDVYTSAGDTTATTYAFPVDIDTTTARSTTRTTTTKKHTTTAAKTTTKAHTTVAPVSTTVRPATTVVPSGTTATPATTTAQHVTTTAAPATTTAPHVTTTAAPATTAAAPKFTASASGSDGKVSSVHVNVSGDYADKKAGIITVSYQIPATDTKKAQNVTLLYNVANGVCMASNNGSLTSYNNMCSVNVGSSSTGIALSIPYDSCPSNSSVSSISYNIPSGVLVDKDGNSSPSHSGSVATK